MQQNENKIGLRADGQPDIHATLPYPENSDMRGFSYRAPQSVNEPETDPKSLEMAEEAKQMFRGQEQEEIGDATDADELEAQDSNADQSDNEDVLERVTGGLRADVPDDNEYDDSTAHAQAEAKKARRLA
jgi:hypothetical protein